jgi:Protein of unknown function (DUF3073)
MGRGRAKAKQTKVARDLKYNSGGMDLDRLRADLVGEHDGEPAVDPELLARYGDLADDPGGETTDEYDADADGRYATGR